jgi:copper homeostasis protein
MSQTILVEACVDSVASALAAQEGGAQRVELCADLLEGGCTPSAGTIQLARKLLSIRLHVIIRPRGGDFCYTDMEFAVMKADIAFCKQTGVDGIVIGILNPDGTVDVGRTRALIELAHPMSVTFHRAFDVTRDPFEALETLIELGIDRVLTTGQEEYVLEGLELIARMVEVAGKRIIIMPGGTTERNVARILAASGATEIHSYMGQFMASPMQHQNPRVFMGGTLRPPEYTVSVTTPEQIRALVRNITWPPELERKISRL